MMWETCKLIGRVQSGKDALNNPTYDKSTICHFEGRLTQWSAQEILDLGRTYTTTHRKLLTKLTVLAIKGDRIEWDEFSFEDGEMREFDNTTVEVDGVEYHIDSIADLKPRYRLLYISSYKQ